MTLTEGIQICGILLEVVFIPLFIWLGKTLIRLAFDVEILLKAVASMEERLKVGDGSISRLDHRVSALEYWRESSSQ
jgi:hypothetical protein